MARTPPETARFDDEKGAGLSDRRGLTSSPSPRMFSARRPCPSRPGVSAAVAHVDPARSLCLSTTGTTAGDPGRLPRIVSVVLRPAMLDSVVDDSLARVCRRAMRQSTSSEAYRAGSGPRRRAFLAEPPIRGVWAPIKSIALYFFQFAFRAHVADHRTPSFSPGSSRLSPSSPPSPTRRSPARSSTSSTTAGPPALSSSPPPRPTPTPTAGAVWTCPSPRATTTTATG